MTLLLFHRRQEETVRLKTVAIGILVCMVSAFFAACSGSSGAVTNPPTASISPTPERSESKTKELQARSPIRQIDFGNFTYPKLPSGKCSMSEVHLTNGSYHAPEGIAGKRPSIDCWSVDLGSVTYGDVTGDGEEDAIVELYAELGGTEGSQDVYIYASQGGKPVLLWKFATGDRADGGPRSIHAENGLLVIELFGVRTVIGKKLFGTEDVGACCPKHFTRTRYKWVGTQFQQDGSEEVFENPSGSSAPASPSPPNS